MIEKSRIQKKFEKQIGNYDKNAVVQKEMAKKLVSLLGEKHYDNILEIGSYSGILTSKIKENIDFSNYLALDVVEKSKDYLEKIDKKIIFKKADVEEFSTNDKFDLIISNAALQWCCDFEGTIKKLKRFLTPNGVLAVSIFSPENLKEIRETFNVSLLYPPKELLNSLFSKVIYSEEMPLKFNTPTDVLKHLKLTGVNSLSSSPLTYKQIKEHLKVLEEEYQNTLTYTPVYLVYKN